MDFVLDDKSNPANYRQLSKSTYVHFNASAQDEIYMLYRVINAW